VPHEECGPGLTFRRERALYRAHFRRGDGRVDECDVQLPRPASDGVLLNEQARARPAGRYMGGRGRIRA
jgi:hypothetical protein